MADKIEPEAISIIGTALSQSDSGVALTIMDAMSLRSIAISLKRIADAVEGDDQNAGIRHMIDAIADELCGTDTQVGEKFGLIETLFETRNRP